MYLDAPKPFLYIKILFLILKTNTLFYHQTIRFLKHESQDSWLLTEITFEVDKAPKYKITKDF